MPLDLTESLREWPFDPHELNVRVVRAEDGREILQMRVELGILQLEMAGRPDGRRPHAAESLLDHLLSIAVNCPDDFELSKEDLDELFREGNQYYQRYLSLFHLERFAEVARDTDRNLRLFRFVVTHAKVKRDQWRFDQYRPYVVMMNSRARAMLALRRRKLGEALAVIAEGVTHLHTFLAEYGRTANNTECFELDFLTRWAEELRTNGPDFGRLTKLRADLEDAVEREDYEEAARLRDMVRELEAAGDRDGGPDG